MLTFVIVAVALIFPVAVILDSWRRRRVEVPETGSEQEVDLPLTQGNGRKLLFGVVLIIETFLLMIAYAANEPGRQEAAAAVQHDFLVERGAHSYVSLCMSCHGLEGQGFLEGGAGVYIGRPLNTGSVPDRRYPRQRGSLRGRRARSSTRRSRTDEKTPRWWGGDWRTAARSTTR